MAFHTTGKLTRLQVIGSGVAGGPWYSGLAIESESSDVDAQMGAFMQIYSDLDEIFANNVTWTPNSVSPVFDVATGTQTGVATSEEDPVVGTATDEMLPIATQVKVSLLTGEFVAGRQVRGAIFLGGITQAINADGSLDPTAHDLIESTFSANLFNGDKLNGQGVVYSPTHRGYAFVSGLSVHTPFSVLRSRRD